MPPWKEFASETPWVAGSDCSLTAYGFGSPQPLGHQSLGLVRCSACLTVWLPEGSRFTGSSKAISPKWPCRVPVTGSDSWFRRVASILTSAPWPTLLLTNGSSIVTGPVVVRYTLFQIPVFRPRIVGIQYLEQCVSDHH